MKIEENKQANHQENDQSAHDEGSHDHLEIRSKEIGLQPEDGKPKLDNFVSGDAKRFLAAGKIFEQYMKYRSLFNDNAEISTTFEQCYQQCTPYSVEASSGEDAQEFKWQVPDNKAMEEALVKLKTKIEVSLKDAYVNWIESFFTSYHAAVDQDKARLYDQLISLREFGKVLVSDQWLSQLALDQEGVITLKSYDINRILLHALLTPPKDWSPAFETMYKQVLEQLKKNDVSSDLTQQLRAYLSALRIQLSFIQRLRYHEMDPEEAIPAYPAGLAPVIPMPYFTHSANELCFILKAFAFNPGRQAEIIDKISTNRLQAIIKNSKQLVKVLTWLAVEHWSLFVKAIEAERWKTIIYNGIQLASVLAQLPEGRRYAFIEAIIEAGRQQAIISSDYRLAIALEQLPVKHRDDLVALMCAEGLQAIIKGSKGLGMVLAQLSVECWRDFIKAIGTKNLQAIIGDGFQLAEVLKQLLEERRYTFIELIGTEKLQAIMVDGLQLAEVLKQLPVDYWHAFIKAIDSEELPIIISGFKLAWALKQLSEECRYTFVEVVIGAERLREIIVSNYALAEVLDTLSPPDQAKLIKAIAPQPLKAMSDSQCSFLSQYKREVMAVLSQNLSSSFKLRFSQGHSNGSQRMTMLKKKIQNCSTIVEVYDILIQEKKACEVAASQQAKSQNSLCYQVVTEAYDIFDKYVSQSSISPVVSMKAGGR